MNKTYVSTRNHQDQINFYQAIVQGIGDDGGLLVPNFDFQKLDLNKLVQLNYVDLATEVISTFVPEDGKELIHQACLNAYGKGLFPEIVVPVKKAGDVYVAELFHGQTAAFKDMALSLLPHLMTLSLKQLKEDREVMILAATSGDTGKAALEGFKDVEGTCIKVFYPLDGVSAIQQQQMVSQEGKNVKVVGIHGNFDDAQSAVKVAFGDKMLKEVLGKYFSTRVIRCPGGYGSWKGMEPLDEYLDENKMISIDWTSLNADAEGKKKNAKELADYAIKTAEGKEMVVMLMHDTYGKEETVKALPAIIKYFKDNGYEFKTLS